jgi:DOMON domain
MTVLLASLVSCQTQPSTTASLPPMVLLQTAVQTMNFTSDYSAEWFTFVDQYSNVKLRMKLVINNVNATAWDNQGEMGYWLSVGMGKTVMNGSDIVLCSFKNTGNPTVDKFLCTDRYSTGHVIPTEDTVDNVYDNATTVSFTTSGSLKLAHLEATFDRLLDTADPGNDIQLKIYSTIDGIWAHGPILSNTIQNHGSTL